MTSHNCQIHAYQYVWENHQSEKGSMMKQPVKSRHINWLETNGVPRLTRKYALLILSCDLLKNARSVHAFTYRKNGRNTKASHLCRHNREESICIDCMRSMLKTTKILCADPENFVRGDPTPLWKRILIDKGGKGPNTTKSWGNYWPASETPFKWRFAGGPMMARHAMLA